MNKDARNAEILMRALRGEQLSALALEFGVTHQRIDQLLAKFGAREAARDSREALKTPKKFVMAERHGITKDQWRDLCGRGITSRWRQLRNNCKSRAIPFDLTLKQYAGIVGTLPIGRGHGKFVLSIVDRERGYVVGNVVVRSYSANARATRDRDTVEPRTAVAPGVYLQYPGRPKPYIARVGRKNIGHFATPEEAIAARDEHGTSAGGGAVGSGQGWRYVEGPRPYRMLGPGGRNGSYATEEEARAAYLDACADHIASAYAQGKRLRVAPQLAHLVPSGKGAA